MINLYNAKCNIVISKLCLGIKSRYLNSNTCVYTRTHVHMDTHGRVYIHVYTYVRPRTNIRTSVHSRTHTRMVGSSRIVGGLLRRCGVDNLFNDEGKFYLSPLIISFIPILEREGFLFWKGVHPGETEDLPCRILHLRFPLVYSDYFKR